MTGEECLNVLAKEKWVSAMKEVFKYPVFKVQKDAYNKYCKQMAAEEKGHKKELEKAEKEAEKQQKEIKKFWVQEEKQWQTAQEKALRDATKLEKAAKALQAGLAQTLQQATCAET